MIDCPRTQILLFNLVQTSWNMRFCVAFSISKAYFIVQNDIPNVTNMINVTIQMSQIAAFDIFQKALFRNLVLITNLALAASPIVPE